MMTPSGRFQTDTRLCLSMSDFHPESWNPLWSVGSILMGLLSFMVHSRPLPAPLPACGPILRDCRPPPGGRAAGGDAHHGLHPRLPR